MNNHLISVWTRLYNARVPGERGQSTAEYALILVAVAALVGVLISFFSSGEGGDLIGGLFKKVLGGLGGITKLIPGLGG